MAGFMKHGRPTGARFPAGSHISHRRSEGSSAFAGDGVSRTIRFAVAVSIGSVRSCGGRSIPVTTASARRALDFFRQKIGMTKVAFNRLERRYREVSFTVARVESVALIERTKELLTDAIAEGHTRAVFERRANEAFRKAGVAPLEPFHLETVFETNVNGAYQAGRASQMLQADVRRALPFWKYRTAGDDRVRKAHRLLDGFVAHHTDAVWRRIYAPNGYRCRCNVTGLTEEQARGEASRRGFDLSVEGLKRLPSQPDEGFNTGPVESLSQRLTQSRKRGGHIKRERTASQIANRVLEVAKVTDAEIEKLKRRRAGIDRKNVELMREHADLLEKSRKGEAGVAQSLADARCRLSQADVEFGRVVDEIIQTERGVRERALEVLRTDKPAKFSVRGQVKVRRSRFGGAKVRNTRIKPVWGKGIAEFSKLVHVDSLDGQSVNL